MFSHHVFRFLYWMICMKRKWTSDLTHWFVVFESSGLYVTILVYFKADSRGEGLMEQYQ